MNQAFICDAIRTPFGRYGGALSSVRTDDLGAVPLKALMTRNPNVDWLAVKPLTIRPMCNCLSMPANILPQQIACAHKNVLPLNLKNGSSIHRLPRRGSCAL